MKLILSGGGTLGPVTPLIALYQELQKKTSVEALFVGTRRGPEQKFLAQYELSFRAISSAKLRRAFDIRNFFIPVFLFFGFLESFRVLLSFKPQIVVSAGGFPSVPLVWAAWFLGMPVLIHQEDVEIGLANLLMAPFARRVTTALPEAAAKFPHPRVRCIGNPLREEIREAVKLDKNEAKASFGFGRDKPVLLVLGGGTGAAALNELVSRSSSALQKYFYVLHVTGPGKGKTVEQGDYRSFEFLDKNILPLAYAATELILSRAGMGVISEAAYLKIPVVLVPIPKSHQEKNASYFEERGSARALGQIGLTPQVFVDKLSAILPSKMQEMASNLHKIFPPDAAKAMAEICLDGRDYLR